jgi:hypothetical protein
VFSRPKLVAAAALCCDTHSVCWPHQTAAVRDVALRGLTERFPTWISQVLGGTYLASYIETHNNSAHVAKLRREWFITYVSSDKSVVPAATACAAQLSAAQLANYTQVGCGGWVDGHACRACVCV